jgi:peptidoglycan/LPS O-acetylase OafA/YrhL
LKSLFEKGRYPVLDGLRAWAILLVLGTHTVQTVPGVSLVYRGIDWAKPLYNGWIGVDLFFVLSGFLVGGQVFRSIENRNFSYLRFYARRAFRIMPSYFFMIAIVTSIWCLAPNARIFLALPVDISVALVLKNLLFVTNYFPADIAIGSWSLSVEEQFYLLIPLVLSLLQHHSVKTKIRFFMCVAVTALVFRIQAYLHYDIVDGSSFALLAKHVYFPFHTRMDALAIGLGTYLVFQSGFCDSKPKLIKNLRLTGLLLIVLVFTFGDLNGGWFDTTLLYSMASVGFSLILLCSVGYSNSLTSRFLSMQVWVPFARLAFSIYLVHIVVLHIATAIFPQDFNRMLMALAMFFSSLFAAVPLYFFIELPLHAFAQRKF